MQEADGGTNDGIGHYGWVIAIETRILVKGNNQALGNKTLMESLQAETYGGLAFFTFIKYFCIYKNTSNPTDSQHYFCDNLTLITHLKYDQQSP
eukprot:15358485-Ditylum_brightwellii.AAC.1